MFISKIDYAHCFAVSNCKPPGLTSQTSLRLFIYKPARYTKMDKFEN